MSTVSRKKRKLKGKCKALLAAAKLEAELDATRKEQLSQLDCPICLQIIPPPIFQCPEGHLLCSDCKVCLFLLLLLLLLLLHR
jgi:E3 ubiquitin-protein ligase SIAH1